MSRRRQRLLRAAVLGSVPVIGLTLAARNASALTWDTASANGDTWNTTAETWDNSTATWTNGQVATFTGAGEVIDISGGISATNITFALGSAGYVIGDTNADATLTLTAATFVTAQNNTGSNTISENIVLSHAANATATVNGTAGGVVVLSGNISEINSGVKLSFARTGSGARLVLAGDNTFSGGVAVSGSGSSIHFNHAGAPGTGSMSFANSLSIDNSSGAAITFAHNNNITLTVGDLSFGGTNDLSMGSGSIYLTTGTLRSIDTNGTATLTTANVIGSTNDSLVKGGVAGAALVVTGNMTYGGGTSVGNGQLILHGTMASSSLSLTQGNAVVNIRQANAIANAAVMINTGTLQLRSDTDNTLFATQSINISAAASSPAATTINVDRLNSGSNLTLRLGNMTLDQLGTKNIIISGGNGYSLGIGTVTQVSGTTLTFTNSVGLTMAGYTSNYTSLTSAPKLTFSGTGNTTITGNITQGSGSVLTLDKGSQNSTLVLQGSSNLTGGVLITNGSIVTAVTNAFGSTSGISIGSAGVLSLRGDADAVFGNGVTPYYVETTGSGATINVERLTAGAPVALSLGAVSISSTHTLNVTGSSGAGLALGAVSGGSAASKTITNNITGGGTLTLASYTGTHTAAQTLTINGSGTTSVGGITQSGSALGVSYSGTGRLNLTGVNSNTGNFAVSNGLAVFGSLAATGANAAPQVAVTGVGTVAAGYGLDQAFLNRVTAASTGSVALLADNSTALSLTGSYFLGSVGNTTYSGNLTALANDTYRLGGGGGTLTVSSQLLVANGTKLATAANSSVVLTAANTYTGATSVGLGATLQGADDTVYNTSTATVKTVFGTLGSQGISFGGAGSRLELRANGLNDDSAQTLSFVNGVLGNQGAQFTVDVNRQGGSGTNKTLALQGLTSGVTNNILNVTGGNGYRLQFSAMALSGSVSNSSTLNPTTASLVIAGGVSSNAGAGIRHALVLGGTAEGNSIGGAIANSGGGVSLTKNGSSTWILNGASTYAGGTTVVAGTLLVNNFGISSGTGTGAVAVSGGTLGGTGRITGAVTVSAGATLLAGDVNNPTENFELTDNVALEDGSFLGLVLGSNLGVHSVLSLSGTSSFDTDQAVTVFETAFGAIQAGTTFSNVVTGVSAALDVSEWFLSNPGFDGDFTNNGGNISLLVNTVPEPGSLSVLALGAAGLMARRRPRRT